MTQKGSRRHYLVPRALHRHGMLLRLVTDFYAPAIDPCLTGLLRLCGGKVFRRTLGRKAADLPATRISSCPWRSLLWRLKGAWHARRQGPYADHLALDRAFGSWAARLDWPPHDVFYGYSYASLEILQREKQRGVFTILDQFDPAAVHDRLVQEEIARWPEYDDRARPAPAAYFERLNQEWALADHIIVNSEWTKTALLEQGVAEPKMTVLSLAYEAPERVEAAPPMPDLPLRVLWIGTVHVAKGIPYLVEAARRLEHAPVQFTVAGPLAIRRSAVMAAPRNIQWLGQIPRPEVQRLYQRHHVFVFPTVSDGFGITQLEALANGLPVIVTPNCARVVEDGETGLVIPPFSGEAIANAILRLLEDPAQVARMSAKCIAKAREYSVDAYAKQLAAIIETRFGARS